MQTPWNYTQCVSRFETMKHEQRLGMSYEHTIILLPIFSTNWHFRPLIWDANWSVHQTFDNYTCLCTQRQPYVLILDSRIVLSTVMKVFSSVRIAIHPAECMVLFSSLQIFPCWQLELQQYCVLLYRYAAPDVVQYTHVLTYCNIPTFSKLKGTLEWQMYEKGRHRHYNYIYINQVYF